MSVRIQISIGKQTLTLADDSGRVLRTYAVSTATKGAGELRGSFCTPRGRHLVRARIGAGQPENTVFIGRRPSGEVYSRELMQPMGFSTATRGTGALMRACTKSSAASVCAARSGRRLFQCSPLLAR